MLRIPLRWARWYPYVGALCLKKLATNASSSKGRYQRQQGGGHFPSSRRPFEGNEPPACFDRALCRAAIRLRISGDLFSPTKLRLMWAHTAVEAAAEVGAWATATAGRCSSKVLPDEVASRAFGILQLARLVAPPVRARDSATGSAKMRHQDAKFTLQVVDGGVSVRLYKPFLAVSTLRDGSNCVPGGDTCTE